MADPKKQVPFWYDKSFILTLVALVAVVVLILTDKLELSEELLASIIPSLTGGYMAGKRGWFQFGSSKDRKEVAPEEGAEKAVEEKKEEKAEEVPPAG